MSVPAVVSVITLGVTDVESSTRFYRALGFDPSPASVPGEVTFFRTAGAVLALWGREALAADAGLPAADGPSAVSLAVNVADRDAVDRALDTAAAAGATVLKTPSPTEWGGYLGYFTDPDGHLWEVTHNPGWPLGADGLPELP